jgi:phage prohead protease, HK97 family
MNEKKIEIRTVQDGNARPVLMREEGEEQSRTIEGYAIVFDVESQVLCDGFGPFIETIDRGALDEATLRTFDIRCLLEHNPQRLLARYRQGTGSLQLTLDAHGLKYRFDAPHTADGDAALELVKRGDLFGCSFAYLADEETVQWGKKPDGTPTRRVMKITYMDDVSLVSKPAYLQTEVSSRNLQQRGYVPTDAAAEAEAEKQKAYIAKSRQEAAQVFGHYSETKKD